MYGESALRQRRADARRIGRGDGEIAAQVQKGVDAALDQAIDDATGIEADGAAEAGKGVHSPSEYPTYMVGYGVQFLLAHFRHSCLERPETENLTAYSFKFCTRPSHLGILPFRIAFCDSLKINHLVQSATSHKQRAESVERGEMNNKCKISDFAVNFQLRTVACNPLEKLDFSLQKKKAGAMSGQCLVVEVSGIEPLASTLRTSRSPN